MKNRKAINKSGFQTANVVIVAMSHLVHDIFSAFLSPLLPLLIKKFSLSYSQASMMSMLQNLPALINPFIGAIADRVKMRYFVILMPSVTAITMSLLGVAPSYTILLILAGTMGLSSALYHIPTPVMMKKVSGSRLGMGMSFYMAGGEIARMLGPLLITSAVSLWTLEGSWKVLPLGLLASFVMYFRLKDIPVSADISRDKGDSQIWKELKPHLLFFIGLTGYITSRGLMSFSLTAFLPAYLDAKGYSIWLCSAALSILQAGSIAGTLLTGSISDKIGRKTTLLIIAIVSPLLMFLFIRTSSFEWMVVLLLITGFFHFSPQPVLLAFVQDIPTSRPAFLNSIYMTITFGISSLSVALVGLLMDRAGLDNAYFISAIIALAGIPFILMIKPSKKQGQ
ncbi:MAG: MFS transporter [Sphingobacteriales bacterium]|nr:MFS transporter [Sphingobacteriales bacterium]